MTSLEILAFGVVILASIPASMVVVNLMFYRTPRPAEAGTPAISLLIPARDEERSIGGCVESALASRGVELEVVVMDDHSADRTAEIVGELAARDPRVRLVSAPPLAAGWNGKQHACDALAYAASHPILAFIDADVRLEPDGLSRMAGFLERSGAGLVSGIPRQRTGTLMEKLVVPLIHFVLLGFLPMPGVRWSRHPSFSAGCGQLFVADREAYQVSGGHAAIRASRHDGVTLPRAFRQAGIRTDLCDASRVAECRMYRSAGEVWRGFAKNADEGMASPAAILPWTLLLGAGQVLPVVLLLVALALPLPSLVGPAALACGLSWGARIVLSTRFQQSALGALLHPVGVAIVLAIQWYAWWNGQRGRQISWKGRVQVDA
ncbi:MAG: glycosyltransferase [Acidobacteriota bacterium]